MKKLFTILAMLIVLNVNAQWVKTSLPGGSGIVKCFAVSGINVFAGIWGGGGVYLSTNSGSNWTAVNSGLSNKSIYSLGILGAYIFAGTENGGVFRSGDNGLHWGTVNNGLTDFYVYEIAVSGTRIFAGTDNGVFISTNYGNIWTPAGLTNQYVNSFTVIGTNLFAGTSSGIFSTTNYGTNWNAVALTNQFVYALAVQGSNLFAGTSAGVFLSSNNGTSWKSAGLTNQYIMTLSYSGTKLIAGTFNNNGIFTTTNNGTNWIQRNQGFNTASQVWSLCINNNFIFAGTSNQSVWRRVLSEILGTQNISSETPSSYSLSQNYPNPFNPITKVKYSILNAGDVKIIVYDVTGREVQTLVNEKLQPGIYETLFDGSELNSGVYFYKLMTEGFSETKRMILLK